MSDRHVVPVEDGWHVEKDHAQRASAKAPTQVEAITRAVEIVANDGGGQVIIHATSGEIRETRTVEAGTDTSVEAGKAVASANAEGVEATAKTAARETSRAVTGIGDDVADTGKRIAGESTSAAGKVGDTAKDAAAGVTTQARKVKEGNKSATGAVADAASIVEDAGRDIAGQTKSTARQVSGEARAAGTRSVDTLTDTAEHAGEVLERGADRAATIAAELDEELDTAADRAARRVHSITERAAQPLDTTTEHLLSSIEQLTHTLNPLRITGRAIELGLTATLRTTAALTSRGARRAQKSVHALTGRR